MLTPLTLWMTLRVPQMGSHRWISLLQQQTYCSCIFSIEKTKEQKERMWKTASEVTLHWDLVHAHTADSSIQELCQYKYSLKTTICILWCKCATAVKAEKTETLAFWHCYKLLWSWSWEFSSVVMLLLALHRTKKKSFLFSIRCFSCGCTFALFCFFYYYYYCIACNSLISFLPQVTKQKTQCFGETYPY